MSAETTLNPTRDRLSFARALRDGLVYEQQVGVGKTETRRRNPRGGGVHLGEPSWKRCGPIAREFEAAGLAERPTGSLPADWKLTPAGEQWLKQHEGGQS